MKIGLRDIQRLFSRVEEAAPPEDLDVEGPCWLWQGSTSCGYGRFSIGEKKHKAHKLSYEVLVGPVPSGRVLDHLCRRRACINPAHLDPITNKQNVVRGVIGRRVDAGQRTLKFVQPGKEVAA